MSVTEIDDGVFDESKIQIMRFIKENAGIYVSEKKRKEVEITASKIMETGIKNKDAIHLACALLSGTDYFLTTDKRILKWENENIKLLNPIDFVKQRGRK
jgi:predicted nucleic acid-binding protein